MTDLDNQTPHVPWKLFLITTTESLLSFYVATFCMAMFFFHHGANFVISSVIMVLLYLFVIFVCSKRVYEKLSMATVMLIIPIAPLIALFIFVSFIPIIQFFK